MERFVWVCLAGAAGTGARYVIGLYVSSRADGFPSAVLLVNLTGCFAMAAIIEIGGALAWSPTVRLALTVGLLGGFTTYSSFNHDVMRLIESGQVVRAAVYVLTTVAGGWAAGVLGLAVTRALLAR